MQKGTILIVDDEDRIRRMLKDFLTISSYDILEAVDGEDALEIFFKESANIHLILLDVMMPVMDGFEMLKELRQYSEVPVIMLTAKGEEYDQLNGFKHGADDYISKPFLPSILLAHIEAVLKRTNKLLKKIDIGLIHIEPGQRKVWIGEQQQDFTPKEYELLLYFIENKNVVLSRDTILNAVWGFDYDGDLRTVDTHVKQLRGKLTSDCNYIKTVHGVGYRFEVEE